MRYVTKPHTCTHKNTGYVYTVENAHALDAVLKFQLTLNQILVDIKLLYCMTVVFCSITQAYWTVYHSVRQFVVCYWWEVGEGRGYSSKQLYHLST
jgi:hypothetical protein